MKKGYVMNVFSFDEDQRDTAWSIIRLGLDDFVVSNGSLIQLDQDKNTYDNSFWIDIFGAPPRDFDISLTSVNEQSAYSFRIVNWDDGDETSN